MGEQGNAIRWLLAMVLLVTAMGAQASYNDECRALATRLDSDPGSLKVGELDLLKTCLGDLQRILVLGDTPPAKKPPQACPPAPAPEPRPTCKACPAVVEPSPSATTSRDQKKRDEKREEKREDNQLRPLLQPF